MSFNEKIELQKISTKIYSGGTPSRKKEEYWLDGKIPWLKTNQIGEFIIYNTDEHITEKGLNESSTKLVRKNSLVIAMYGDGVTRGKVSIVGKELTTNQACCVIEIDPNQANYKFIYYQLKQSYNVLRHLSNGGAQQNLNVKMLKEFKVKLPLLTEQNKIAEILYSLDKKIETNNKINKKLEEMAQAIFKQWFVDFEFPNEDGKPYKSSGGEMVESELGMIPKGWEVDSLSNLVKEVITGKTPSTKKSENYGDKYPFVTIPDMHNKVFVTKTERYLSEDGHKLQEKKLIPKNSILVSCIATVGLVSISSEAVHTNQQINSIIPNSIEEVFYFYEYLKLMEDRLKRIGSAGSATLNVNKGEFEKIKYIYPNSRIINKYNNTVKNIYEKIKLNEIENNRLAQLRDTLLPKLMSGEIRVPLV